MSSLFLAATPCRCGSGEPRRELRDAMNIFCGFVCGACETETRAHFDPRISPPIPIRPTSRSRRTEP